MPIRYNMNSILHWLARDWIHDVWYAGNLYLSIRLAYILKDTFACKVLVSLYISPYGRPFREVLYGLPFVSSDCCQLVLHSQRQFGECCHVAHCSNDLDIIRTKYRSIFTAFYWQDVLWTNFVFILQTPDPIQSHLSTTSAVLHHMTWSLNGSMAMNYSLHATANLQTFPLF